MPPQGKPRAEVAASLDLAATPPVLWATFTDLDRWPRWIPTVRSACCVSGTEWTLGAQFELMLDLPFPAGQWKGIAVITEVQPAASAAWEMEYPLDVIAVHSVRFAPTALGTLLTLREAYYGGSVLLYRLSGFPGRMCRAFEVALQNLKTYLEVGA